MSKKEKCITPSEVQAALKALDAQTLHKLVDYIQAIIRWKRNPEKYLEPISKNGKTEFIARKNAEHAD